MKLLRALFLAAFPGRERKVSVHVAIPPVKEFQSTQVSTVQPTLGGFPARGHDHQETAPAIFPRHSRWKTTML